VVDDFAQAGDTDVDYDVDITDFNNLAGNFAPSGYAGPFDGMTLSEVPEPTAVVLFFLGCICFHVPSGDGTHGD